MSTIKQVYTAEAIKKLHNTTWKSELLQDWCRCPVCQPELHQEAK